MLHSVTRAILSLRKEAQEAVPTIGENDDTEIVLVPNDAAHRLVDRADALCCIPNFRICGLKKDAL